MRYVLILLLLAACGTTDKVLDNQQRTLELYGRGGDANTDPVNVNPKTMLAMPGATGNDLEDYSTTVEERSHAPIAGDVFAAALTGGMGGITAENSTQLAELAADVKLFRGLWLADTQADGLKAAEYLALWNAAKVELAEYEAKLQADSASRLATVAAMPPPNQYTYQPMKVVIIGSLKGATAEESLSGVAKVISAKRGEVNEPE